MPIEQQISELLFRHDCVIIPRLGGFVLNPVSSRIDPSKNILYPPSKKITFNCNLNNNDGLLANYITQKEHILYPEAIARINSFVTTCNFTLEKGAKVEFEKVGFLVLDEEKNIRFEPDTSENFLLDSFGFESIHFIPVNRKGGEPTMARINPLPAGSVHRKRQRTVYALAAVYLGLLLATSGIFFSINDTWYKQILINYTSFNPFQDEVSYIERITDEVASSSVLAPSDSERVSEQPADGFSLWIATLTADTTGTTSTTPMITENVPKPKKALPAGRQGFFIIGGCFKVYENAEKFIRKLKKRGFDPSIVNQTRTGLFRVCFSSHHTETEALQALTHIRKTQNRDAWLYSN